MRAAERFWPTALRGLLAGGLGPYVMLERAAGRLFGEGGLLPLPLMQPLEPRSWSSIGLPK